MDAQTAFESAERRYLTHVGLDPAIEYLSLPAPRMRARVLRAGEGSPVVYVHGGGGCGANFAPLAARLPGRSILVDRPGCGGSDAFTYRGVDLRAHAVDYLRSIFDALRIQRAPIVANSMGALWSLWFALAEPTRVESLTLLGCPALFLGTSAPFGMRLLSVRGLNRVMFALERPSPASSRRLFARMGHDPRILDNEAIELTMAMQRAPTWAPAFGTLLENVMTPRGARITFGEDELRRVRAPLAFIWGESDTFGGPEVGRAACAIRPDATLDVVPGGHLPWLDDPARCAELVRAAWSRHGLSVSAQHALGVH